MKGWPQTVLPSLIARRAFTLLANQGRTKKEYSFRPASVQFPLPTARLAGILANIGTYPSTNRGQNHAEVVLAVGGGFLIVAQRVTAICYAAFREA